MLLLKIKILLLFLLMPFGILNYAQDTKISLVVFDGVVIAGYVDYGGYLNFTGPNINVTNKKSKFILGMLPSLRFKEDLGSPKNAFVTPNLGVGFTYCYKMLAIQLPLYYNAKTTTNNGQWHIGLGIGLRLNALNKDK